VVREPSDSPGGEILGRVVAEGSQTSIPKAEVTLSTPDGAQSLVTGPRGEFAFRPKSPGAYQVASVRADGYVPFGPEWGRSPIVLVSRVGLRVREVTITLAAAKDILGRVTDAGGTPVSNASIRVLVPRPEDVVLFPTPEHFQSDARGEFHFRGYAGISVEASHPSGTGQARVDDDVLRQGTLNIVLQPPEGTGRVSLGGRVIGPEGTGVSGALVAAHSALHAYPKTFGDSEGYRTMADADGRFEIPGVIAGTYDVSARLLGAAPAYRDDVRVPGGELTLTLGNGSKLHGRVTDRSGAPIPAFGLQLEWQKAPMERLDVLETTVVDADGRFELNALMAGTYVLTANAQGYVPASRTFATQGAADDASLDLTLEASVPLTGFVRDAVTHVPLSGARVALEGFQSGSEVYTDSQGAFTLDGLPAQGASLSVGAPQYNTRIIANAVPGNPLVVELTPVDPDAGTKIQLVGIGAVLRGRGDGLVIGQVMPGGGAATAGLVPGDEIVSVDGNAVTSLGFVGAVQAIRGPEGTAVLLGIRKGGQPPPVEVTVTRVKIEA
jgi:hypothetical protein